EVTLEMLYLVAELMSVGLEHPHGLRELMQVAPHGLREGLVQRLGGAPESDLGELWRRRDRGDPPQPDSRERREPLSPLAVPELEDEGAGARHAATPAQVEEAEQR